MRSRAVGGGTSSIDGNDGEMRNQSGTQRPLKSGDIDDMVYGVDVCDEIIEANIRSWHHNDTVGEEFTEEMTGHHLQETS